MIKEPNELPPIHYTNKLNLTIKSKNNSFKTNNYMDLILKDSFLKKYFSLIRLSKS